MATGLTSTPPPRDENDPFRLGWRYVNETGLDGAIITHQVPLTEADVLHPQEDDFIVQDNSHIEAVVYLWIAFKSAIAEIPNYFAFSDHRIDFGVRGIKPFGPDVVVFDNIPEWKGKRGATFHVAAFNARPLLVVEVTSETTRDNDIGKKVDFYERCGVQLYVIIDRLTDDDGTDGTLWAYQLGPDGYEIVEPDDQGRLWLEPVKLWLTWQDGKAVCFQADGNRILPPEEEPQARRKAEKARREADKARLEADKARRESDKALRESEKGRREAEKGRLEAEQVRLEEEKARRAAEKTSLEAEERAEREARERQAAIERAEQAEARIRALEEKLRRRNGE